MKQLQVLQYGNEYLSEQVTGVDGLESLCCICLDKVKQKSLKEITRCESCFYLLLSDFFVLERITCVRAGTLSTCIHFWALEAWLGICHGIIIFWHRTTQSHIVKKSTTWKNKSVTKTQRTMLLFRGLGWIRKNPSKFEPFSFVSQPELVVIFFLLSEWQDYFHVHSKSIISSLVSSSGNF